MRVTATNSPNPPRAARARLVSAALAILLLGLAGVLALPARGAPSFPDVPPSHPYAAAIADLAGRGVVNGFSDGTFGPSLPVIRQQFAKMIVLTMGLPVSEADICPFGDVDTTPPGVLYPDHHVAVAASWGITKGTSPGRFSPRASITRAQVISMVVRAADGVWSGLLSTPTVSYGSTWDPALSSDHGSNWRRAEWNGLLQGLPLSSLDPFAPMPRGEVAQVVHNLLVLKNSPVTLPTISIITFPTTTTPTTLPPPPMPEGDLLHFYRRPGQPWKGKDVTFMTGRRVAGPAVPYVHTLDGVSYDHLAAMSPTGDLLVFWHESLKEEEWQVVDVTAKTGRKIAGPPVYWRVQAQTVTYDHLAAMAPDGSLLVFWWTAESGWNVVDVTQKTGQKVAGYLTGYVTWQDPQAPLEHVAATSPSGDLLLFTFGGGQDWRVTNVSAATGKGGLAGPLRSYRSYWDVSVAAVTKTGQFRIYWTPHHPGSPVADPSGMDAPGVLLTTGAPYGWYTFGAGIVRDRFAAVAWPDDLLFVTVEGPAVRALNLSHAFVSDWRVSSSVVGFWDSIVTPGNTLAAISPAGEVYVFREPWNTPGQWVAENVTASTGPRLQPLGGLDHWFTYSTSSRDYDALHLVGLLKE